MEKNPTFAVFLLFGRETTAEIVKPDLFLSENQTKNTIFPIHTQA